MAGVFGFAQRFWQIVSPPTGPPKNPDALKFGILGAANIAPPAIIVPAQQHGDVIIQAVAARNKDRAAAFAKKHGIPQVFDSYDALLADPSIDCVFIPLPNGLHYEWALKALAAGKHVLCEKPSVSNTTEAELLFRHPILQNADSPVMLEAFHYRFHPAWTVFTSFLDRPNIAHAKVNMMIPKVIIGDNNIRWEYSLAGGALMDLCYTSSVLRGVFGKEPEECTSCEVKTQPEPQQLCDNTFDATWKFPGGATAEMHGTLVGSIAQMINGGLVCEVMHRPTVVADDSLPADQEKVRTRKVRTNNFLFPTLYHRIDVEDTFVIRKKTAGGEGTGELIKTWKTKESKKAYTFGEGGFEGESQPYWLTYRYQLDAFVDRIRGRNIPTGAWVDGEDSIKTMKMIDMAYGKCGLPLRPTSSFRLA
ncbi:hypothetical protein QBC37DRAFT_73367 [Rhypophila decipiens]|uniref:D-xylose 1-dehydrogenase (NADP(+), D-xylono-1,5-lactone-forming) n=1 Tax=Rhypophila decipiens TaxID=261697 RepID=A0AAN6YP99_9PEZI|nr:hypothetical protein QBC37DRAFT_73367 [Rhypophila decipiens]